MSQLNLSVVSPVKTVLQTECSQITVPTQSGLITILPSHAPLFSLLHQGEVVVVDENKKPTHLFVAGGFVSVTKNKVILLVDYGIHSDELDEKIILEAKERAEKVIAESKNESLTKIAQADLLHASLQIQFLNRHKNHHGNNVGKPH